MPKSFTRNIEDFTCEKCGYSVKGDGYTNHCPKCLWSKHVDVNPGDRAEECHGLMKPEGIIKKGEKFIIVHQCQKCGFEKNNKVEEGDDMEEIMRISEGWPRY